MSKGISPEEFQAIPQAEIGWYENARATFKEAIEAMVENIVGSADNVGLDLCPGEEGNEEAYVLSLFLAGDMDALFEIVSKIDEMESDQLSDYQDPEEEVDLDEEDDDDGDEEESGTVGD